jgi:phosphatidate cytidylyltransferase
MSSLIQRLLTAVVLIPVVVWLVLIAPDSVFMGVLSVIFFITAYEWSALSGENRPLIKIVVGVVFVIVAYATSMLSGDILHNVFMSSLVFWLLMIFLIIAMPQMLLNMKITCSVMLLMGFLIISVTFASLLQLRLAFDQGSDLLMYLLLLIWTADSGAYFAGRAFGKHKLAPTISPGKSIEGVFGGFLACLILSYFAAAYFRTSNDVTFIALSLFVAFISVYGDLFESLIKRRAGVKDSGNILPGHGGMLDRIDSLIAAGPVFVACLLLSNLFAV